MLEWNRSLANNAPAINPYLNAPDSLADQLTAASSSASFSDVLNRVQLESMAAQNETSSGSAASGYSDSCSQSSYGSARDSSTSGTAASAGGTNALGSVQSDSTSGAQTVQYGNSLPVRADQNANELHSKSGDSSATPNQTRQPSSVAAQATGEDQTPGQSPDADQSKPSQSRSEISGQPDIQSQASGKVQPSIQRQKITAADPSGLDSSAVTSGDLDTGNIASKAISKGAAAKAGPANQAETASVPQMRESEKQKRLKQNAGSDTGTATAENQATQAGLQTGSASPSSGAKLPAALTTVSNTGIAGMAVAPALSDSSQVTPAGAWPSSKASATGSNAGLAFALKIKGDSAGDAGLGKINPESQNGTSNDSAGSSAQTSANSFASLWADLLPPAVQKPVADAGSLSGGGESSSTELLAVGFPLAEGSAAVTNGPETAPSEPAPEAAAGAEVLPQDAAAGMQTVKNVQVQITGADDQKVDLRIVEKSGALTMSVRSGDDALTKSLQQNLPELATRLSDQQIQAEWWRPAVEQSNGQGDPGNERSGYKQDQSGQGQSGQGQSGQDTTGQGKENSGQQGGRGATPPAWLDDLIPRKSNQNGTQFSWHL